MKLLHIQFCVSQKLIVPNPAHTFVIKVSSIRIRKVIIPRMHEIVDFRVWYYIRQNNIIGQSVYVVIYNLLQFSPKIIVAI